MFVSSTVRLTYACFGNVKIIRSCACNVLRHYEILSPKSNPCTPLTYLRLLRLYAPKFVSPDVDDDHPDKEDSKYLYLKLPRKENVSRLMECTGCNETLAHSMLKDFPRLRYLSSSEISRLMKFLSEKGIPEENILINYWLLTINLDALEERVAILDEMGVTNFNLALPLLRIPREQLKKILEWSKKVDVPDKTKIQILCEKMKCDPVDIVLAVSVHKFLRTLPFNRINAILDILLAEGVPSEKLLKDMWVFRYSVSQVQERVRRVKDGGVEQFKTWMVRCTEKILRNTIRIQAEKRVLLGPHNDSTVNYISSRLNLKPDDAELILLRHPQLRGVGAAKLCNTLDFLLGKEEQDSSKSSSDDSGDDVKSANFKPYQVWTSSRILCHSLETTKARLARLRSLGFEPKHPAILYTSKRKFEAFVQKLEKQAELEKSNGIENLGQDVCKVNEDSKLDVNR